MLRLAASATALCLLASPATATEWLNCSDRDGAASVDLLLGAMDVAAVAGVTVSTGDQVWATHVEYGPGDPITVGQAFETPGMLMVDVMDPAMVEKIAEVRLFKASEGELFAYGGTLRIPGYGAWAVSCSGP
jgi:hypothetical protein